MCQVHDRYLHFDSSGFQLLAPMAARRHVWSHY
jgi:hypothetical protein